MSIADDEAEIEAVAKRLLWNSCKGMTTNMRQRTRKKHGIAKAASPDGRKTISDRPGNHSHWRGRR